ncbi:hypothetical protein CC2G_005614 [Coprinopsis cinerea AmutBmut pab1-1]|nr:hypothetical protein CC2G_005614 [Coprinopsis cinerea AmutBmut pab1-1]
MASTQHHNVVNGVPTTIIIQTFADRILVLVTQLGKVGNLIQANLLSTSTLPLSDKNDDNTIPTPSPAIQLTPLLGSSISEHQQTLHSLYASQIATIVWDERSQFSIEGHRRSVVVGIALKRVEVDGPGCELSENERATFRGIMTWLQDIVRGAGSG